MDEPKGERLQGLVGIIQGPPRIGLWVALLLLTLALLLFPTHFVLEYSAIQSVSAINNLPLFVAAYTVWFLLVLLLLLTGAETWRWEKPTLVGIFALVFIGFWLINGPNAALRYDGVGNAAHVSYLSQQADGGIAIDHPNLKYFNFPGMHLFSLAVVQVTGLDLPQSVTLVMLFHLVLLTVLLYLLFLSILGSPSLSAFGVLVAVQGNIMWARYSFYPGIWGLIFLVMFLILLHRQQRESLSRTSLEERIVMVLLLVVTSATHIVTAVALFAILLGIFMVRNAPMARKTDRGYPISAWTLVTFLVIPLAWDVYWATRIFKGFTEVASDVVQDFAEKGSLFYLFNIGQSYAGGAGVPLWAVLVRYFWWIVVFGGGTLLWLRNVLRIRRLSGIQQLQTGSFIGIILLSGTLTLPSPGGAEFYRFLLYGTLLTVPIILHFYVGLPAGKKALAARLGVSAVFLLSLPTFLSHNNLVQVSSIYPSELEAGAFLKRSNEQGEGLTILNDQSEYGVLFFNVPDATFSATPQVAELKDAGVFWRALDSQVDAARMSPPNTVFYFSKRRVVTSELFFRIRPEDPGWETVRGNLSQMREIYANGTAELYISANAEHETEDIGP